MKNHAAQFRRRPVGNSTAETTSRPAGFTLIELMISVALVVFLILGVNQVFLYTSQAVGVGEAINTATRDARAAGGTFSTDLLAIVPPGNGPTDAPFLIISSSQIYAFNNAADQTASKSGRPDYVDLANTGIEGDTTVPGDVISPASYGPRNHRTDTLSFFARDLFRRQTGNLGTYVDNMASQEAWIWYGHAWLPDNSGTFSVNSLPGMGNAQTNPNNRYGSQFVLARMAMLLKEKSSDTSGATITDPSGVSQRFFDRSLPYPTSGTGGTQATDLQPLSVIKSQVAAANGDTTLWQIQQSRFDLAATTISAFRDKLRSYIGNTGITPTPGTYWWNQMMTPAPPYLSPVPVAATNRFQVNPFIPKPIDSVGTAQAAPYFIGGCSQFVVEYAGDYLTQNNNIADTTNYGTATAVAADGQIDYILIPPAVGTLPRSQWRKQIIWYGLPRNTSGLSTVSAKLGDVMPLNDWIKYFGGKNTYTFEKTVPNYSTTSDPSTMQAGSQYLCAWGPNDPKPKLIRITITITDPAGRIPQGLTYQYVYAVP